jgi:hypothetical protein
LVKYSEFLYEIRRCAAAGSGGRRCCLSPLSAETLERHRPVEGAPAIGKVVVSRSPEPARRRPSLA